MNMSLLLLLLAAGPSGGADAFVRSIYAAYDHGGSGVDWSGPRLDRYFDPALAGLIRRDVRRAHGEVPTIDGDPFCDCQDASHIPYLVSTREHGDRARAVVRFREEGAATTLRLDLVRTPVGWRVDDIHAPRGGGLRALLGRAEAAHRRPGSR